LISTAKVRKQWIANILTWDTYFIKVKSIIFAAEKHKNVAICSSVYTNLLFWYTEVHMYVQKHCACYTEQV